MIILMSFFLLVSLDVARHKWKRKKKELSKSKMWCKSLRISQVYMKLLKKCENWSALLKYHPLYFVGYTHHLNWFDVTREVEFIFMQNIEQKVINEQCAADTPRMKTSICKLESRFSYFPLILYCIRILMRQIVAILLKMVSLCLLSLSFFVASLFFSHFIRFFS